MPSMQGCAAKSEALGVRLSRAGARSSGPRRRRAVTAVDTDLGDDRLRQLVVARRAVAPRPLAHARPARRRSTVQGRDGKDYERPMWTYWCLQEGTLGVDPARPARQRRAPAAGHPRRHRRAAVRRHRRLRSSPTSSGASTTSRTSTSAACRAARCRGSSSGRPTTSRSTRTVPQSPEFVVGDDFVRMWTLGARALPQALRGQARLSTAGSPPAGSARSRPTASPSSTRSAQNAYVIADSNHGYKMIGVGALVAKELLGERQALLEPFRFSRFAEGRLHPVSHSPFPWS